MGDRRHQEWTAVMRVFDAPGQVFQYLAEQPVLLPPYAVSTALGAVATAISLPVTFRLMESEFALRGLQSGSVITNWIYVGGVIGALIGPFLAGLFISALLFGMLWIGGQGVTFKGIFCILGYARLPLSVGILINAFLITHATSSAQVKQMSLSAAALAPSGAPPVVTGFLSTLAPFDLWYLALVALGTAAVTHRPVSKVWWVAALLYGLNLLMAMLGSGLSTSMSQ